MRLVKDTQYYKFCSYGFLKNLRFYEPFLVLFFLSLNLSYFQIGLLYGIREVVRNILEIPSGVISDTLGRRKTMMFSFGTYALSFVLFFFSSTFVHLVISMSIFAIGDAFRTGTHKAMIFAYLERHNWREYRSEYYGRTRACSQLGSAVSALLAAVLLLFTSELRYVFLFSAAPAIADLLLIRSYPTWLDGSTTPLNSRHIRRKFALQLREMSLTITQKDTLKSVANLSFFSGFYRALKDFVQPLIKQVALGFPFLLALSGEDRTTLLTGLIYFVFFLISSQASRHSQLLIKLFGNSARAMNATLLLGGIIFAVGGLFTTEGNYSVGIIAFLLIFLMENMRNPIGTAFVSNRFNDAILSSALSANSQFKSLVAAIIAPLFGYMADLFNLGWALFAGGLLLLPMWWLFRVKAPQ
ncbi:MAG: MFS transporter [Bacteroidales bacterium]